LEYADIPAAEYIVFGLAGKRPGELFGGEGHVLCTGEMDRRGLVPREGGSVFERYRCLQMPDRKTYLLLNGRIRSNRGGRAVSEKEANSVAYIIRQIRSLTGEPPGKSSLQKMVYLLQAEGVDLGFPYKPHCYGVFSPGLDAAVSQLIAGGIVRAERKGSSFLLETDGSAAIGTDLGEEAEEKIERVIVKYRGRKSAELGLLATAHYVNRKLAGQDTSAVVRGVQKIMGRQCGEEAARAAVRELAQSSL